MNPAPLISVVVPVRNRAGVRLANCLNSLRWQDLPASEVEVIVSDFGSDAEFAQATAECAEAHGARLIFTDEGGLWNRSRALNIGVRAARGRYILATDVDMIFAPNFLRVLVEAQEGAGDDGFILCRCRDLPEGLPEEAWLADDYPMLFGRSDYREAMGVGACQMARGPWFHDVRGYDEGYRFWGVEDRDMHYRAERSGLTSVWVHEQTSMLHQWHPTEKRKRPYRKALNDLRFYITKYRVRKNSRRWGL